MTCKHQQIRTWVYEDTKEPSGLWSCVDCGLKFEPITQRTWIGLTNEDLSVCDEDGVVLARYWEAKLKQKNGYAEEKNT